MKNSRPAYLVISVLSLFNVLFLPIYAVPEWVMAETGSKLGFYNAVQMLLYLPSPLEYWTVYMTLAIFVPCVALFISALIGRHIPFLISSLAGVTLWAVAVWTYAGQFGISSLFVLDGSGVGIGLWIAIALFMVATAVAIAGKNRR